MDEAPRRSDLWHVAGPGTGKSLFLMDLLHAFTAPCPVSPGVLGFQQDAGEACLRFIQAADAAIAHLTAAGEPRRDLSSLIHSFVASIRDFEHVAKVMVETRPNEDPRVWTLIDAPIFEFGYREPIFDAQLQASEAWPEELVEFRLLNVNELTRTAESVLPTGARTVYERGH